LDALSRSEITLLRSLKDRRRREERGSFLAEGVRVVEELVASPVEIRFVAALSSLGDTERGAALLDLARSRGVALRTLEEGELRELADTGEPQGVIAVGRIPDVDPHAISLEAEPAVLLVLDAVQDPGNVGTLIRAAEALGARGVVALPGTADPWNPKVVRAAAGSLFRLPVLRLPAEAALAWFREAGLPVLAAAGEGDPLPAPPPRRAALVVGNEGAGVTPAVRAAADRLVGIPLRGRAESLNVASAAAILLHDLLRA
jgi:RNA methyltransferase, TrmH family